MKEEADPTENSREGEGVASLDTQVYHATASDDPSVSSGGTIFYLPPNHLNSFYAALSYVTRVASAHPSGVSTYARTVVEEVFAKVGPLYPALLAMHAGARYYVKGPNTISAPYTELGEEVFDLTFT